MLIFIHVLLFPYIWIGATGYFEPVLIHRQQSFWDFEHNAPVSRADFHD